MAQAIAYYRVSTRAQGRSALGLDAQRAAVARFAEGQGIGLLAEFLEAESGKGADAFARRPQLRAAMKAARSARCPVLVAKLDRLSRDVAFISGLMAQRTRSWSRISGRTSTRSCCTSTQRSRRRSAV